MAKYNILSDDGTIINTILAERNFIETHYSNYVEIVEEIQNLSIVETNSSLTITSEYNVLISDSILLVDVSNGSFQIILPSAIGIIGNKYKIKKIDSSNNYVTIATSALQTIDGEYTKQINIQWESIELISDGNNWIIV